MLTKSKALMRFKKNSSFVTIAFALFLLGCAALKLYAARLLAWEVDYVPVLARSQTWLDGGAFPVVGTLSSVAAFNMPFLVWMQLPALLITKDLRLVLVGTQLSVNLLTTCIVYRLGGKLFDRRAGLLAALLFAFSNVGIAGAYTAWAQLQLPFFFALFAYCLFRWKRENRAWQAALALITATAAFMTHFSALLLYGLIAFVWLVAGLPFNRRGLLAGLLLSLMLLAPYLVYEAQVDFVDIKAHVSRRSRVSAEDLAQYAHRKPTGSAVNETAAPKGEPSTAAPAEERASRLQRGITFLLRIPSQIVAGLRQPFSTDLLSLRHYQPALHSVFTALRLLLEALFWYGMAYAMYRFGRLWRSAYVARAADQGGLKSAWRLARHLVARSAAGRSLMLFLLVFAFIAGLCLARAAPDEQPSYYYGVLGLQFLLCGYGISSLVSRQRLQALVITLVFLYVGMGAFDAILKVSHHNRAEHSPLNLNLYSSINEATYWIASDWGEPRAIAVNYDLLPEMAPLWWVLPWHTVDESYRIGMAFDYLLKRYYGLENSNHNPTGIGEAPDYVVTSARGLERYDMGKMQVSRFGALYVLKPS